jgi:hypothetical protein
LHNQGATEIITRLAYLARIKKEENIRVSGKKVNKKEAQLCESDILADR